MSINPVRLQTAANDPFFGISTTLVGQLRHPGPNVLDALQVYNHAWTHQIPKPRGRSKSNLLTFHKHSPIKTDRPALTQHTSIMTQYLIIGG